MLTQSINNCRAYDTALRPSSVAVVSTECIVGVAKRCNVLEQQLLLTARMNNEVYMRNRLAPK